MQIVFESAICATLYAEEGEITEFDAECAVAPEPERIRAPSEESDRRGFLPLTCAEFTQSAAFLPSHIVTSDSRQLPLAALLAAFGLFIVRFSVS